jgi:hypothetical protein
VTDTLLVLGQAYPNATVLTALYTAPTATTVSSLTVCNLVGAADYFRISIAPGGASDTQEQYVYYDLYLDPNDTFIATVGFTLAATDVVRCRSLNGYLAFNLFGVQVS